MHGKGVEEQEKKWKVRLTRRVKFSLRGGTAKSKSGGPA